MASDMLLVEVLLFLGNVGVVLNTVHLRVYRVRTDSASPWRCEGLWTCLQTEAETSSSGCFSLALLYGRSGRKASVLFFVNIFLFTVIFSLGGPVFFPSWKKKILHQLFILLFGHRYCPQIQLSKWLAAMWCWFPMTMVPCCQKGRQGTWAEFCHWMHVCAQWDTPHRLKFCKFPCFSLGSTLIFLKHKYDFSDGRDGTCWELTVLLKC